MCCMLLRMYVSGLVRPSEFGFLIWHLDLTSVVHCICFLEQNITEVREAQLGIRMHDSVPERGEKEQLKWVGTKERNIEQQAWLEMNSPHCSKSLVLTMAQS